MLMDGIDARSSVGNYDFVAKWFLISDLLTNCFLDVIFFPFRRIGKLFEAQQRKKPHIYLVFGDVNFLFKYLLYLNGVCFR